MAYTIKITTTKPQGTLWYYESGIPGAASVLQDIAAWNALQPGYVSSSGIYLNSDVYEFTIVFDSLINGDAWITAKQTEPAHMVRNDYLASLPVTQDITIVS